MEPPKPYVLFPALQLGYTPFDDWHQVLIDHLNTLSSLPSEDTEGREGAVCAFVDAFVEHLHFEIEALQALGYPDVDGHVSHHRHLENKLDELLESHNREGTHTVPVQDLAWFLLEDAIKEDLKAKYFLEGKDRVPLQT